MDIYKIILIAAAVSADAGAESMALGSRNIKLPFFSAAVISFIGAAAMVICAVFSDAVCGILPEGLCKAGASVVIFLMGVFSLFKYFRDGRNGGQDSADRNKDKRISAGEAAAAAAGLSVDSAVMGLSAGMYGVTVADAAALSAATFIMGIMFTVAGYIAGRHIAVKGSMGWLGGAILIVLAFVI